MTYTIPRWEMAYHVKAARQAHTRAIGWKKKAKACLKQQDVDGHNACMARYERERNYVRGIMLVLTSVMEHKTPGERRAARLLEEKMRKECVA